MQNAKCKQNCIRVADVLHFDFCILHCVVAVIALAATANACAKAGRSLIGFSPAIVERRWNSLAKGADVNQTQADGTTPLHWAVYRFDRELVQTLLKKGARVNVGQPLRREPAQRGRPRGQRRDHRDAARSRRRRQRRRTKTDRRR